MTVPTELKQIVSILSGGMIWIYIGIFFLLTYLFISLLTWSFLKPLKYVGIPTALVGLLFLIIRMSLSSVLGFFVEGESIIKVILPSMLRPILINGLICLGLGVLMVVIYIIINNKRRNKNEEWVEPIKEENVPEVS